MDPDKLRSSLKDQGLKVTPQRVAVYEAITTLNTHPTADELAGYVRKHHPNIATGTVYKVLETLVRAGLIRKVKTDKDVMRYDAIMQPHHHIYCEESEKIEDYFDPELDSLLQEYFRKNHISEFEISEVRTQITGRYTSGKKG